VFIAAIISAFFANLSPSWGLFFTILLGGKFYRQQKYVFIVTVSVLVLIFLLILKSTAPFYQAIEIAMGVILPYLIFYECFLRTNKIAISLAAVFLLGICFSIIRLSWYGFTVLANFQTVLIETRQFIADNATNFADYPKLDESFDLMEKVVTHFGPTIWVAGTIFAVYFGCLLFAKKHHIKIYHQYIQFSYYSVYLLITGLFLTLLNGTKYIGLNMLFMLTPLYFIQGLSIMDFYWRKYMQKSKLLIYIMVVMIIFNAFFLLLIIMMGLMDTWFNFRKLKIQEEINESNHD
jgi:hypothetical protein